MASVQPDRIPVLYLAPWVDYGGSDKGTIDWFGRLDRTRFAPSLVTTQPSPNRRLGEVVPFAEEVWALPDLVAGSDMPQLILDLIETRRIRLLHIMNSRLAYELLPDLASLPEPPRVVVQLHVEEPDRGGYVRLVCRRFGNLVDGFSVSSRHLARAVEGYDVPRAKIHVIPTGVDAAGEFDPARVEPRPRLEAGAVHVLYPGRLVEQKDPLLMVEVAARAVAARPELRFHAVGDGPLEGDVRAAVARHGLERHVVLHPPTTALAGWYRSADLLLMTSVFEGVPYVLYESLAMAVPAVAPALPGNVELLAGGGGVLIEPRDDAGAYADALVALAADAGRRRATGAEGRRRALAEYSLDGMARAHEALYDDLLAGATAPPPPRPVAPPPPPPLRFRRDRRGTPLVSVIVPCFDHGRYLPECLDAIRAQSWPAIETIVVDDASPDPDTRAALDALEHAGDVTVLRMPERGGPSRARNAALEVARGRYVLPVDADNILLPDAVERLVGQLAAAGEEIGFVYPNLQYFGNRRDYFEAPEYNLFWLLEGNYCDTCSLFDADVFRAGVRFDDTILLGHEDWELVLELARRGVRGEPAGFPTLLYRKSGFNRSDAVEHAREHFSDVVVRAHPEFYGEARDFGRFGWHSGPAVAVKARWRPGVSVVALAPVDDAAEVTRRLAAQTCRDAELVVRSARAIPDVPDAPPVRRIPAALADCPAAAMTDGLQAARAPLALVTAGTAEQLLADRAIVEKLVRAWFARPGLKALVLCDAGAEGRYPFRPLGAGEAPDAAPHSILFAREDGLPATLPLSRDAPLDALAQTLVMLGGVEWRHVPGPAAVRATGRGEQARVTFAHGRRRARSEQAERDRRFPRVPAVPALPGGIVRRWAHSAHWMPPMTVPLVRHRAIEGEERVLTNAVQPPPGFLAERVLGSVHVFQGPGMAEVRAISPTELAILPDADEGAPLLREPQHPGCLGFIEEAPLPLLDALELAYFPHSRQWVLATTGDPMLAHVEQRRGVGFIEAWPNHPQLPELPLRTYGLRSLVRTVDIAARRHRYGVGALPAGELSLELGCLHAVPGDESVPVWLDGDRLQLQAPVAAPPARDLRVRARWVVAPVTWRDTGPLKPRVRATVRRAFRSVRAAEKAPRRPDGGPAGFLWRSGAPNRQPVYEARHPVTGDQLLTPWPLESADLGYGEPALLGYTLSLPVLTGTLEPRAVDVPWASRFGRRVRRW